MYPCMLFLLLHFQYADMNSARNIFIFGFSMFSGLVIPNWILKNPTAIATGANIKSYHITLSIFLEATIWN